MYAFIIFPFNIYTKSLPYPLWKLRVKCHPNAIRERLLINFLWLFTEALQWRYFSVTHKPKMCFEDRKVVPKGFKYSAFWWTCLLTVKRRTNFLPCGRSAVRCVTGLAVVNWKRRSPTKVAPATITERGINEKIQLEILRYILKM